MANASIVEPSRSRPEVLVVEDHPTTRKLMSAWLETSGYSVKQAGDGNEAWASAQQECPPIVVTDWNMPSMSGLELCRYIREQHGTDAVYVLIATSRDGTEDLSMAMDAGANDFLSKPVKEDEFLARIRNAENSLTRLRQKSEQADSDALTGLLNRRSFYVQGQRAVMAAHHSVHPLTCIAIDIDLFKKFNDEHGHNVGDKVLTTVAKLLKEMSRSGDLAARLGGDEFCLLLPNTTESGALRLADRIRERLVECEVTADGECLPIRLTLGVAPLTHEIQSITELVDVADGVLRAAKNEGRDRAMSQAELSRRRSTGGVESNHVNLLEATLAKSVMEKVSSTLRKEETIGNARSVLLSSGTDCLCVIEESGVLVGVVTERDLLNEIALGTNSEATIEGIVSSNISRFPPTTPMSRIWASLQRTPMLRNVIVNDQNEPIGLVRRRALLRLLHEASQSE